MREREDFASWFDKQLKNGALGLHGIGVNEVHWMRPIMSVAFNAGREAGYIASDAREAMRQCADIAENEHFQAQLHFRQSKSDIAKGGAIAAKSIAFQITRNAEMSLLTKELENG